jgi:hypothetical protein
VVTSEHTTTAEPGKAEARGYTGGPARM